MKIEFEIPDEKAIGLHDPGKTELLKCCKKWTENILDEATRIETSRNETDVPDVTAAIINEATLYERRFPYKRKKKWWVKLIQLGAFRQESAPHSATNHICGTLWRMLRAQIRGSSIKRFDLFFVN